MDNLSREELWEICKTLTEDLKEAVFSEDTADAIWNISQLHNIKKTSKLAKLTGQVLMGLLPPQFFKDTIQEELGLDEDTAKKASIEMEHYVFNQVKDELNQLYSETETETKKKEKPKEKSPDTYRESIE